MEGGFWCVDRSLTQVFQTMWGKKDKKLVGSPLLPPSTFGPSLEHSKQQQQHMRGRRLRLERRKVGKQTSTGQRNLTCKYLKPWYLCSIHPSIRPSVMFGTSHVVICMSSSSHHPQTQAESHKNDINAQPTPLFTTSRTHFHSPFQWWLKSGRA